MASLAMQKRLLVFLFIALLLGRASAAGGMTEVRVELELERWAVRGGAARLRCLHNVPPHLLDKVVFLRNHTKIYQYIRNRKPPTRNFTTPGAVLNIALATDNSIVLQDLQFAASGTYSCEVTMDTPIYTKASHQKQLTVFQPQRHNPRIQFPRRILSAGEVLMANCTSAPALPAPHITWFINGNKMDELMARSQKIRVYSVDRHRHSTGSPLPLTQSTLPPFSLSHSTHVATRLPGCNLQGNQVPNDIVTSVSDASKDQVLRISRHQSHRAHRAGRDRDLYVTVSELQLVPTGRLHITCVSTIPEFRTIHDTFADVRNDTAVVEVIKPQPIHLPVANLTLPDKNVVSSHASRIVLNLVLLIPSVIYITTLVYT